MEKQLKEVRGGYAELYEARSKLAEEGQTMAMYYWAIFDAPLFMFIGLAFFKLGILQGEAKTKVYAWMAVIGLGVGLPLSYLFVHYDVSYHFNWFEIVKNKKNLSFMSCGVSFIPSAYSDSSCCCINRAGLNGSLP